jgi:Ca2+-binding RTX toxin-like protein
MATNVFGGNGNDPLADTPDDTNVYGLGGADTITAVGFNGGTNLFNGGEGTDTVVYSALGIGVHANLGTGGVIRGGGPIFIGEADDSLVSVENLTGTQHDDWIYGSTAANVLRGLLGDDLVDGGSGHDSITGDGGDDSLLGGFGDDTISGGNDDDTIRGGQHDDSLSGGFGEDRIHGDHGNDTVDGGDNADSIEGGFGADHLRGGTGTDTVLGGLHGDTIEGGSGNDRLDGGDGIDTVVYTGAYDVTVSLSAQSASGAWGDDTLLGFENATTGTGDDHVTGTGAANVLKTSAGEDTVMAGSGDDRVESGTGADLLYGHSGDDTMISWHDDDEVYGYHGADSLDGGSGEDTLSGGDDEDIVLGGAQDDLIRGGEGADTISGGSGADTFRWEAGDLGTDLVYSFGLAEGDRFSFGTGFFATEPVGATELSDVLYAFPDFAGGSFLMADTAVSGWVAIAQLDGVAAAEVNAMIADESILAVSVGPVGEGAPGGFGLIG